MQVTVRAKHLDLTEPLKDYAKKKLARLEKHFDHLLSADVTLCTERNLHVVDVTVHADGVTLRAEEKSDSMYASIDQVVDKLERQVQKYKEKMKSHHRGNGVPASPGAVLVAEPRIKRNRQKISVMSLEQAAIEMESGEHKFFLFLNRDTEGMNLMYRRESGDLAVLEPLL